MSAKHRTTGDVVYFPEPRDVELERALLGCLMIRNVQIEAVASFLRPVDFSEPLHQRLYDAMVRLAKAKKDVSPVSLGPLFADDEALNEFPGYFVDLMIVPPSTLDATRYARALVELSRRREITGIGKGLQDAAKDLPIDLSASALVEQASAALSDIDLKLTKADTVSGGVAASLALSAAWSAAQCDRSPGISLGLEALDKAIGGAHPGDMIVLAGRPGMGKSAVACCIARNVASDGGGVLYVSCEMTQEQLGRRLLSDAARDLGISVPYQSLRAGKIDAAQYEVCQRAAETLTDLPIIIDDRRKPPLPQIIASAKSAARKFDVRGIPLRLIIVDHMQLVAAPHQYKGNRVSEVTEVSGELKALARDLGVPLIACSQLNRDLEGRDVKDKRPTLRDLRESGAIEQDADIVMMLFREEYYHLIKRPEKHSVLYDAWEPGYLSCKNQLDVIIAKNREGEPGTVKLHCNMAVSAIRTWRKYA